MSSLLDTLLTIDVGSYRQPLIVGFDHDRFLNRLLELGHSYFDTNRVYAMLLDTTPLDLIETEMKSYKDIVYAFPNDRLFGKALYIGNYNQKDWLSIAEQVAEGWKFKIIEVVE